MTLMNYLSLAACFVSVVISLPAYADEKPEAWPCEQVYVSEVSAAVLWAGPLLDPKDAQAWRNDESIARLVRAITQPSSKTEDIEDKVTTFAKALPAHEKNTKLSLAFFGALEVMNKRRHKFIQGILKFSIQQAERAKMIDLELAKLSDIKAGKLPDEQRQPLEDRLMWQQRMFDDRERSIRFLCEQPVDIEVALGDLARALSNQMD